MDRIILLLLAQSWARGLLIFFRHLGGWGLFLLGILDSSFLFIPLGNDLLLLAMVSGLRRHEGALQWDVALYILLASLGSIVGVLLLDIVVRPVGEHGLTRLVNPRQIKRVTGKLEKNAAWMLILTALLPPPFPFTAVIMVASALIQYPRKKLLASVFVGRLIRFSTEALLAIYLGRRAVNRFMESNAIEYVVYFFLVMAIIGTTFTVWKLVASRRTSRSLPISKEPLEKQA